MSTRTHHMLALASAVSVLLAPVGASNALVHSDKDLQTRIADLEAEVARLRTSDGDRWLTEERAAEIRALVQDVLTDADTRASLLQGGGTAGYDRGFFLASADGNYSLRINGRAQFRYVFNHQEGDGVDNWRSGFENRRTRLMFSGHIVDPSWTYQILGDFSRDGGAFALLDAYVAKTFDNGVALRAGQFKPPFNREFLISSGRLQTVERSLVNSRFFLNWSQGVQVSAPLGEHFRFAVMIHDGARMQNTQALAETTEFAITGRADVLLAGSWSQANEFSSWRGEDFGAILGAAAHWQKDEFGTSGPLGNDNELELFQWTVDGMLKFGGANIFAAFIGSHGDFNAGESFDRYGAVIQGGFFLTDDCEIFARYEWGDADSTAVKDLSIITFGVNKYWSKHNLKWQTDIGIGLNEVDPFWATTSAGWRGDVSGEDTQLVVRSQLQLAF